MKDVLKLAGYEDHFFIPNHGNSAADTTGANSNQVLNLATRNNGLFIDTRDMAVELIDGHCDAHHADLAPSNAAFSRPPCRSRLALRCHRDPAQRDVGQ